MWHVLLHTNSWKYSNNKLFWDHDTKWCIHAVDDIEIDFHFSVLQPHIAFFTEGISNLKQVTGCEHHNIQQYIVGVITGAVSQDFLITIWSAMELDDKDCDTILVSLQYISKLKLLQSIIPNSWANGAAIQFSADIMKHAHITKIKNQAQAGNN